MCFRRSGQLFSRLDRHFARSGGARGSSFCAHEEGPGGGQPGGTPRGRGDLARCGWNAADGRVVFVVGAAGWRGEGATSRRW